jgi:hypothetical protein
MTSHERIVELAVAALDFSIDSDDQRLVNEHLAACETCRDQVGMLRADRDQLSAATVLTAPAVVRQRLLVTALDSGSSAPLIRRPVLILATVALLLAVAIAGVTVGAGLLEVIFDARLPVSSANPSSAALASAAPSVAPSAIAEVEWMGYRQVQSSSAFLRSQPKPGTEVLAELTGGAVVSAWNAPVTVEGDAWQLVHFGEVVGWIPLEIESGASLGEVVISSPTSPLIRVDIFPDVIGPQGTLTFAVADEGRLIRPAADGYGWTEQWLTPAGMELLRASAVDSGLFDAAASYPPRRGWLGGFATTRISVRGMNGRVTVQATNASDGQEAQAVLSLGEQLVELLDELPEHAIVDPSVPVQPHAVGEFNLLVGFSDGVLSSWPADQVAAIPMWVEDATLPLDEPLLESGEPLPEQDVRCGVIDAATAAALRDALWAAGYEETPGGAVIASFTLGWRATNGTVTIDINAVPPGEAADCSRYGGEPAGSCVESPDLRALLSVTDPLGCYGSSELSLEGFLAPLGPYDPVLFVEPSWLCCPADELTASRSAAYAGEMGLWLVASPESGITLRDFMDTTVRIRGHFDDPAAGDCEYTEDYSHLGVVPGDAVIGCRRTFVATSIVVVP